MTVLVGLALVLLSISGCVFDGSRANDGLFQSMDGFTNRVENTIWGSPRLGN
ncbi:MAG: hypothetical protein AAFR38_02740 [Planctomycetota bacterium]